MYPPFRPKKRWLQYWIFRFKHGFFPCDCWNLDHELALWLLPRLKHFKKTTCAYPYTLVDIPIPDLVPEDYDWDQYEKATPEDWQAVLAEMIEGFELKTQEWNLVRFANKEDQKKIDRAFELLGRYGQHLWD